MNYWGNAETLKNASTMRLNAVYFLFYLEHVYQGQAATARYENIFKDFQAPCSNFKDFQALEKHKIKFKHLKHFPSTRTNPAISRSWSRSQGQKFWIQ